MPHARDAQSTALTRWEEEGGARPSERGVTREAGYEAAGERAATHAVFDAAHDSSVRGEHRYPDGDQTNAEREARHDRDELKRRLAGRNALRPSA